MALVLPSMLLEPQDGPLRQAFQIAEQAHGEDMYRGVGPYTDHLLQAARLAWDMGYATEVQVALLLHDTLEDTDLTAERLIDLGVAKVCVDGVVGMTAFDTDTTEEKIGRARAHPISHIGKVCDSSSNLAASIRPVDINKLPMPVIAGELVPDDPSLRLRRVIKYTTYLGLLEPGLPSPADIRKWLEQQPPEHRL